MRRSPPCPPPSTSTMARWNSTRPRWAPKTWGRPGGLQLVFVPSPERLLRGGRSSSNPVMPFSPKSLMPSTSAPFAGKEPPGSVPRASPDGSAGSWGAGTPGISSHPVPNRPPSRVVLIHG